MYVACEINMDKMNKTSNINNIDEAIENAIKNTISDLNDEYKKESDFK